MHDKFSVNSTEQGAEKNTEQRFDDLMAEFFQVFQEGHFMLAGSTGRMEYLTKNGLKNTHGVPL